MAVILKSGDSTDVVHVTPSKSLSVALDQSAPGPVLLQDANGNPVLTTENGSLDVNTDQPVFWEQVDGSALNTNVWATSASTATVAQANGFIVLNAASSLATGAYAILNSIKSIPLYGTLPLKAQFNAKLSVGAQANSTVELGLGTATGTSAPTDGAFFRWDPTGAFKAVMSTGGAETTATISGSSFTTNNVSLFEVVLVESSALFYIDDTLVAQIDVPDQLAYPTNAGRQTLYARVYNGGSAPSIAAVLSIGQVVVVQQAMQQGKQWGTVMAQMGRGSYQSPVTAFGQTANHTNSTSPTSATLSNTATGYTTLGGRYQFAAVSGAATDYALFGYQVPAGYQLVVNEIVISAINTGVAVAVTPTILDWALGINASAVSLATADGAGTWAPRRVPLGTQGFTVAQLAGQAANDMRRTFNLPLVVDGGRYLHVILQIPVGTATISQIIRGDVAITGFFE